MNKTGKIPKTIRSVQDTKDASYVLSNELSRGGQGIVYFTDQPNILIKGFTNKDEETIKRWRKNIAWLIQQDFADLQLARPLILLKEPRNGYVMELMDGLVSLQSIFDSFIKEEEPTKDYIKEGGLRRRIRILIQVARTLNQLHSRGMLYGDLSPSNIFVSNDPAYAEAWIIDCDNISLEAHSGLTLHTVDYGAPEVVRNEALLSSLTDCWSFAVIAYQLLTHNHPLKGAFVDESEPSVEEEALQGQHPWINDSENEENICFSNIPFNLIEFSRLPKLFKRCFEEGKQNPVDRPSMAEWLECLTEINDQMFDCLNCDASSLLSNEIENLDDAACYFCEEPINSSLVLFEEFIYIPKDSKNIKLSELKSNLIKTGRMVVLAPGQTCELKRMMPSFDYDRWPSDHLKLEYLDEGLWIYQLQKGKLNLEIGNIIKLLEGGQGLKEELKGKEDIWSYIHIGELEQDHIVWRFKW